MSWQSSDLNSEPDLLVSLCKWLDSEVQTGITAEIWFILSFGATAAFGGAVLLSQLLFHFGLPEPTLFWLLLGIGCSVTTYSSIWYFRTDFRTKKALEQRYGDSWDFLRRLWIARSWGRIRNMIGEESAIALNDAAGHVLRCRAALTFWGDRSDEADSVLASTRANTNTAMNEVMLQILRLTDQGVRASSPQIQELLRDLKQTADEVVTVTQKFGSRTVETSSASNDLRQVLMNLRSISEAYDEIATSLDVDESS